MNKEERPISQIRYRGEVATNGGDEMKIAKAF